MSYQILWPLTMFVYLKIYDILELVILVALIVVKLINELVGVEFIELLVELWVVL